MRIQICLVFFAMFGLTCLRAQTGAVSTNPLAEKVLLGKYNPLDYIATAVVDHPDSISQTINARISVDTIKANLLRLAGFYNRNSGSDTNSSERGIGATRRWIYSMFEDYGARSGGRLIPSYLQFTFSICNQSQHRNIYAVLPGSDTSDASFIVIEAHVDSRCSNVCDSLCQAQGIEDNGSGTALVMELARVMSAFTFKHSIVFLLTIAEEQGLNGATAFTNYARQKNMSVKAVLNNDIVGGVYCGKTASSPGCSLPNGVDSTHVRLFSAGGFNSAHKQLARYIKLEYQEQLLHRVSVPMSIDIMSAEDRLNRGGDHIPFRGAGYSAVRFTSANEHGDASNSAGYTDRQHTSADVLGVDTDSDSKIDSFFVDFKYCARNAVINGNAAAMIALSPRVPDFEIASSSKTQFISRITKETAYPHYRIAVRSTTNDWDTVYTTSRLIDTVEVPPTGIYAISVASVNEQGIESLFSRELTFLVNDVSEQARAFDTRLKLLPNYPNPFDEATILSVYAEARVEGIPASIIVCDMQGKTIQSLPVDLHTGINEVLFHHESLAAGSYTYSLVVSGRVVETRQMVLAN